jgi:hypothetical protein
MMRKRAQKTELDGTDFLGRLLHILPATREIAKHTMKHQVVILEALT